MNIFIYNIFKAAWSNFLASTVQNNFPYKQIIQESYRLTPDQSPFTDRKMQLMEIKISFCMGTQKNQHKY